MSSNINLLSLSSEKEISQIPALQELIALGYDYLSPNEVSMMRKNKNTVLLEDILVAQLEKINSFKHKGKKYLFSEKSIEEAVHRLKNIDHSSLLKSNEGIFNSLIYGVSAEENIEGIKKSYNLNYIDWKNFSNNIFHVVPEFCVEKTNSSDTVRPDIVLFVNGIPLGVIECKAPNVDISEAISQNIRNQKEDYIPKLFSYIQLVMAVNKNTGKYGTVGTSQEFWSFWKEQEDDDQVIYDLVNTPLSNEKKDLLFKDTFSKSREFFDNLEASGKRSLTEQDKLIYSLCRPERLLELIHKFIFFDGNKKKIARYQQFFVVKETIKRVNKINSDGKRDGGLIWHTQGSGKSLTMVMLVKSLLLNENITNPRIVLVTDRTDLDNQLKGTFDQCDVSSKKASSGKNLIENLKNKESVITTLIQKFYKAAIPNYSDLSEDVFVIIDESHRTNFGALASKMRKILPNACYLGFTGTPLLKKEKNNITRFGALIEPHYSISQAVEDEAVLPLLYEGRHVEITQDQKAIDLWFDRHTSNLTKFTVNPLSLGRGYKVDG